MSQPSRYATDPRVTAGPNDGYMVDVNGVDFYVQYQGPSKLWGFTTAEAAAKPASWVVGYTTAADAIAVLTGVADRRSETAA